MVLLMSVNPGFGGQVPLFRPRLENCRSAGHSSIVMKTVSGRKVLLEVDGGVKKSNIREIAAAGADTFVAGSANFQRGRLQSRY